MNIPVRTLHKNKHRTAIFSLSFPYTIFSQTIVISSGNYCDSVNVSMAPSELAALRALIEDSTKSLTALINYNRDELLAKFEEVKTELTAVKSVATAQSKEIFILKTKMNEFEQQDKARSLRIFGLRITKEDDEALGTNKAVVKRIYDRIVKPILTIAKSKNMIDSVPQLGNCLVEGYRVGLPPKSDSATPPLVVKFLTKEIRDVVLKLKRENTPPPPAARRRMLESRGSSWWRTSPPPPTPS